MTNANHRICVLEAIQYGHYFNVQHKQSCGYEYMSMISSHLNLSPLHFINPHNGVFIRF